MFGCDLIRVASYPCLCYFVVRILFIRGNEPRKYTKGKRNHTKQITTNFMAKRINQVKLRSPERNSSRASHSRIIPLRRTENKILRLDL